MMKQKGAKFDLEDLQIIDSQLGKGAFGIVRLAKVKKLSAKFAVKGSQFPYIKRQIKIHKAMNHPNIIALQESFVMGDNFILVMEFAENGSLFHYQNRFKIFSQQQSFKFFYGTAKALEYMHIHDFIHRDIKPQNILVDAKQNPKLCDFGWSTNDISAKRKTFCGTYQYMAPEMIFQKQYDYRVELWSLGILLYQLLHGRAPFKGKTKSQVQQSLNKNQIIFKEGLSTSVMELIRGILNPQIDKRLLMKDILSHRWVTEMLKLNRPKKTGHKARNSIDCSALSRAYESKQKKLKIEPIRSMANLKIARGSNQNQAKTTLIGKHKKNSSQTNLRQLRNFQFSSLIVQKGEHRNLKKKII